MNPVLIDHSATVLTWYSEEFFSLYKVSTDKIPSFEFTTKIYVLTGK